MEVHIELLHAIIDGLHLIITHHPDSKLSSVKTKKGKGKTKRKTSYNPNRIESKGRGI